MTVSPFSNIFPPDVRYRCPRKALSIFDRIAYLYEIVEYRRHQLEIAQQLKADVKGWFKGCVELPQNRKPQYGMNETDAQNAWSIMVFSAELESYLSEIIRFINLSFVLLNDEFFVVLVKENIFEAKELRRIDTVSKYIKFKNEIEDSKKLKALSLNAFNDLLEANWNEWVEYISWIRNYLTHDIPLSGTIFDVTQIISNNEGFYCIRFPTKERLQSLNKMMNREEFQKSLEQDFSDGKLYHSENLIRDNHHKFQSLAHALFNEEMQRNSFWWQD